MGKDKEEKKKKKGNNIVGIIIVIILFALALVFGILYFSPKEEMVKISFDSAGGDFIESVEVKKGSTIKLPTPKKEGYTFEGWYIGEEKITEEKTYEDNTTLTAKYTLNEEEKKTFTITFDSNGGTAVESITLECGQELKLPANPTKNGYDFMSWVDKNEVPVYDQALLSCEDITLKANWNKKEEKKEETKKTYKCPDGYTLNGTKCKSEKAANEKCPSGTHEYEGKCLTVNNNVRKEGERSCPELMITYMSYAEKEKGDMIYAGTYFCYYHAISGIANESACTSQTGSYGPFVWRNSNSTCYVEMRTASMSCDNLPGYVYIGDTKPYVTNTGLNGGCFPLSEKEKYCDVDYKLTGGKCIKEIDATAS